MDGCDRGQAVDAARVGVQPTAGGSAPPREGVPTQGAVRSTHQRRRPPPRPLRRLRGRLPPLAKRAMSIVGACLLLVIALDLMASLQVHTADWLRERLIGPKKPPSRWVQAVSRSGAPTGPNRRQLSVQFDRERLTVSYDLWMPTGHPVFKEVRQGQAEGDPARFVVDLFGEVRVGEFPLGLPNSQRSVETTLAFEAPVVDSTASEGHIQVTAKRYEAGLPRLQIVVEPHRTALWLSSDLVVVRSASRLQVFSQSGPAPTWQSADVAEFDRLGQASTPLSFAVADRSEDSLTATLRRVGGTTVPVLDYAIWGLLGSCRSSWGSGSSVRPLRPSSRWGTTSSSSSACSSGSRPPSPRLGSSWMRAGRLGRTPGRWPSG